MSSWRDNQRRRLWEQSGRKRNIAMAGKVIDAQAHRRERERKARSRKYLSELEKIHAAHQAAKNAPSGSESGGA